MRLYPYQTRYLPFFTRWISHLLHYPLRLFSVWGTVSSVQRMRLKLLETSGEWPELPPIYSHFVSILFDCDSWVMTIIDYIWFLIFFCNIVFAIWYLLFLSAFAVHVNFVVKSQHKLDSDYYLNYESLGLSRTLPIIIDSRVHGSGSRAHRGVFTPYVCLTLTFNLKGVKYHWTVWCKFRSYEKFNICRKIFFS